VISISDGAESMQICTAKIFDRVSRRTSSTQEYTPSDDITQIEFPWASLPSEGPFQDNLLVQAHIILNHSPQDIHVAVREKVTTNQHQIVGG